MKAFNLKTALQDPEGTRELYIHGLPIKEFPEAIFELKQLRKLELTSNQLVSIPESINRLEQLEELILNDNQLTVLPNSLRDLKHLKTIQLNNNRFSEFPKALLNCLNIESISIEANSLKRIPRDISRLTQVHCLKLDRNEIRELPDELTQLTRLSFLSFSNNAIRNLPSRIGDCSAIKTLIANQNLIGALVPSIAKLSKLRTLDLNGNQFKAFPKVILACKTLEKLSLCKCNLKTIPNEIHQLSVLTQLDLSFNKLTELPDTITSFALLKILSLQSNKINKVSRRLFELKRLKHLNLSKNPLTILPTKLYELEQLESLAISGNWDLKTKEEIGFIESPLYGAKYLFEKYQQNPHEAQWHEIFNFLKELIYFKDLTKLSISPRYLTAKQTKTLLKFIKICRRQGLANDLRLAFFQLLLAHESAERLDKKTLLIALSFKHVKVRTEALKILQTRHSLASSHYPLQTDSRLVFLGKSIVNRKSIKTRLRKTGIKVEDRFSLDCSHVVLGDFPDRDSYRGFEVQAEASVVILQTHQIMAYLTKMENSFLSTTENEETLQNLSSLLLSKQVESVELAIQILKTINITTKLHTDLLIAFKESKHAKHKRNFRNLLASYLDANSNRLVKELDWKQLKEAKFTKTLLVEKLQKTSFDANRIWAYIQKKDLDRIM